MNYYVYRHIRLDKNIPFYIGIGKKRKVFYTHKQEYKRAFTCNVYSRNDIWFNIINKTSYRVEILLDNVSKKEAYEKEMEFIKLYGKRIDNTGTLANITDGGDCSNNSRRKPMSEEERKKASERMKLNNPNKDGKFLPFQIEGVREQIIERMKSKSNPAFLTCRQFEVSSEKETVIIFGFTLLHKYLNPEFGITALIHKLKKNNNVYSYKGYNIKLIKDVARNYN